MMDTISGSTSAVEEEFIRRLQALEPAELRILREATGSPLGDGVAAFDLFNELWRPLRRRKPISRWACYLVATLFPWHPGSGRGGNLAASLRLAARRNPALQERVAKRFALLLAAKGKALDVELVRVVRLLRRKGVPIDWVQLLKDLSRWYDPGTPVQAAWAETFTR